MHSESWYAENMKKTHYYLCVSVHVLSVCQFKNTFAWYILNTFMFFYCSSHKVPSGTFLHCCCELDVLNNLQQIYICLCTYSKISWCLASSFKLVQIIWSAAFISTPTSQLMKLWTSCNICFDSASLQVLVITCNRH